MREKEIRVSKEVLPSLPERYEETRLGDLRGARRQFRTSSGVHVREYDDDYVVHVDRVDPRSHPLGHLVMDSPETLVSGAAGLIGARIWSSGRERGTASAPSGGILTFFLFFFATNGLVRLLKRIFSRGPW